MTRLVAKAKINLPNSPMPICLRHHPLKLRRSVPPAPPDQWMAWWLPNALSPCDLPAIHVSDIQVRRASTTECRLHRVRSRPSGHGILTRITANAANSVRSSGIRESAKDPPVVRGHVSAVLGALIGTLISIPLISLWVITTFNLGPIVVVLRDGRGLHTFDLVLLSIVVPVWWFLAAGLYRRWRTRCLLSRENSNPR